MAEVSILAVHWQNGDRYQLFMEIVPQPRELRSDGHRREGVFSILGYLRELTRTDTTATVRSRALVSDTLSSASDRSGFEHFTLSKVLETAQSRNIAEEQRLRNRGKGDGKGKEEKE